MDLISQWKGFNFLWKWTFLCFSRRIGCAMQIWKVSMLDTSSQQQAFHDHPKHPPLLLVLTDDDMHFTSHLKKHYAGSILFSIKVQQASDAQIPNFAKLLLLSHWCWNPISNILIANFIARISQEKRHKETLKFITYSSTQTILSFKWTINQLVLLALLRPF